MKLFQIAFVFLFIAVALSGCASSPAVVSDNRPGPGYVYHPHIRQGQNMETVRKDLAELLGTIRSPGIKYFGRKGINTTAGEAALRELVSGKSGSVTFWYDSRDELLFMAFSHINLMDDRIEVTPQVSFSFNELAGADIAVKVTDESASWGRHVSGQNIEGISRPYIINFPGLMTFKFERRGDAERFADDLYFIQQAKRKPHDERRARFEARLAEYRQAKVKPALSEEQRKYIVQANAMNQGKQYARALELYEMAVDVDPIAYPVAYFNMALLTAQMNNYRQAISYMKRYLLLEPEAKDARSAQDKIYEWEAMLPPIMEISTLVTTSPPDSIIEVNVTDSGKEWIYAGRAPLNVRFWRVNATQRAMLKISKPGYLPQEQIFSFDKCPPEIHVDLTKAATGKGAQ